MDPWLSGIANVTFRVPEEAIFCPGTWRKHGCHRRTPQRTYRVGLVRSSEVPPNGAGMTRHDGSRDVATAGRRRAKAKRTTGVGRTGARFPSAHILEPDEPDEPPDNDDDDLAGRSTASDGPASVGTASDRTFSDRPASGRAASDQAAAEWAATGQARSGHAVSDQAPSGHVPPGHAVSDQARSGHAVSDHVASDQARSGHAASGHVASDQARSGYVASGHAVSDQARSGHVAPGHVTSGHDPLGQVGAGHVASGRVAWDQVGAGHVSSGHGGSGDVGLGAVAPGYVVPGHAPLSQGESGFADFGQAGSGPAAAEWAAPEQAASGWAESGWAGSGWPGSDPAAFDRGPTPSPPAASTSAAASFASSASASSASAAGGASGVGAVGSVAGEAGGAGAAGDGEPDDVVGPTGARFGPYSARKSKRAKEFDTGSTPAVGAGDAVVPTLPGEPTPEQSAERTMPMIMPWAGALVRPYAHTGGRTRSSHDLAIEALVSASGHPGDAVVAEVLTTHHRRMIVDLCAHPRSVAEVAALLAVPLGVARVLLGDLAGAGAVVVHPTAGSTGDGAPDVEFMRRVLVGLRRL